ncbi:hypothetical protein, partial [Citrobacter freundii]|uniref:hypothetical protein n=1 Tax=Citrobacter freundii TaxID=546 RepID=UPI001953F12A
CRPSSIALAMGSVGFIGFVLLAVNYVTLSSIVKSTEKKYSLAESEIEDFRNTVVEINSLLE